ncbi:MAG: DMT family transporter [Pseudomonadota bacterium]
MSRPLFASLVIAIGAAAWGLYWVPLRLIEETGVGAAWAVILFNLPALIVAGAVFAARPSGAGRALMIAGFMAGMGLALYAMGLVMTSVVRATLLFYLTPVWSTLIAMAVLKERPGAARWIALTLAMAGLALILGLGSGEDEFSTQFGLGEAVGLASGVAWAISAVLIRRAGTSGNGLVFYQFLGVMVVGLVAATLIGEARPSPDVALAALTPVVIGFSVFVLASIYAIFWAVAQISPGRSGLLMLTEVVVAVLTASILLPEETLSPTEWAGAALIVGAGFAEVFGES